jgi:hypothetical protein
MGMLMLRCPITAPGLGPGVVGRPHPLGSIQSVGGPSQSPGLPGWKKECGGRIEGLGT